MFPRLRRRRLRRFLLFGAASLALFALGVWLALILAEVPGPRVVRVLPAGASAQPQRLVEETDGVLRVRERIGPGREQEFEIRSTDQGVLVRPAPERR